MPFKKKTRVERADEFFTRLLCRRIPETCTQVAAFLRPLGARMGFADRSAALIAAAARSRRA